MIANKTFHSSKIASKKLNIFKLISLKTFTSRNSLRDKMQQEIEHEVKNYEPVNAEDKNAFLTKSGFHFGESPNSTALTLQKTLNNYEIKISFQARLFFD